MAAALGGDGDAVTPNPDLPDLESLACTKCGELYWRKPPPDNVIVFANLCEGCRPGFKYVPVFSTVTFIPRGEHIELRPRQLRGKK